MGVLMATGLISPWIFLAATVLMGVIWASCVSELFVGGFYMLLDSEDKRRFEVASALLFTVDYCLFARTIGP